MVPRVAAGPFVAWCEGQLRVIAHGRAVGPTPSGHTGEGPSLGCRAHQTLAFRLGVDPRTMHRYLRALDGGDHPATTLSRDSVEDMLHRAGEDFYAVYPDYLHERDIELEPDQWCPWCQQTTTPMGGICLWCDHRVVGSPRHVAGVRGALAPTRRELGLLAREDSDAGVRLLAHELAELVDEGWSYGGLAA